MATLVWMATAWGVQTVGGIAGQQDKRTSFVNPIAEEYFWNMHLALDRIDPYRPVRLVLVDYGQAAGLQEYRATAMAFEYLFSQRILNSRFDVVQPKLNIVQQYNPNGGMLFGDREAVSAKLVARNLGLAMEAGAHWPGTIDHLYFCFTKEDDVPMPRDTSTHFIDSLGTTLEASEVAKDVSAPLSGLDKMLALRQARRWWPQLFDFAFSCWLPVGTQPCGSCRHCVRFKMFEEATR